MSMWRATMPREKPAEGKVHFVLATVSDSGRSELTGELEQARLSAAYRLLNMKPEYAEEAIKAINTIWMTT